ncbi:MAG: CDP-alcohol phosphatidyltransferase family protein [Planctomycetota bacterium]
MPRVTRQQIPNLITVARLLLAAAFFAALNLYRYPDHHRGWAIAAIVLFVSAALTDALDGYLARRWNVVSTFGRVMDPFVDKVLVLGAFVYLASPRFAVPDRIEADLFFTMASGIYPWMVVVIIARELLVTAIRGVAEGLGVEFGAKQAGKMKMVLQSSAVPIIILVMVIAPPYEVNGTIWICHVLAYATLIATVWSGLPYVTGLRAILRDQSDAGPTT